MSDYGRKLCILPCQEVVIKRTIYQKCTKRDKLSELFGISLQSASKLGMQISLVHLLFNCLGICYCNLRFIESHFRSKALLFPQTLSSVHELVNSIHTVVGVLCKLKSRWLELYCFLRIKAIKLMLFD